MSIPKHLPTKKLECSEKMNNSGPLKVKFLHLVHFTGHIKKTMSSSNSLLIVYNVWDGGRKAKRL